MLSDPYDDLSQRQLFAPEVEDNTTLSGRIVLPAEIVDYAPDLNVHKLRHNQEGRQTLVESGVWSREQAASYELFERSRSAQRPRQESSFHKSISGAFVGWDGEGCDVDGRHQYTLLANSKGHYIENPEGLGTEECLNFLCDQTMMARPMKKVRDGYRENHVCYGASYDCNMMLRDVDPWKLKELHQNGVCYWQNFRIAFHPRHYLQISRYNGPRNTASFRQVTCTLWDVIGFFQCSFVKALEEWLPLDRTTVKFIEEMKAKRGTFENEDPNIIREYCLQECELLVRLMTKMRQTMKPLKLIPERWDGAGAVSAKMLRVNKVREHMKPTPKEILMPVRMAYFGGRIESVRYGHAEQPAYGYDIRSAYPAATRSLPCLSHGEWTYSTDVFPDADSFSLIHIRFNQGSSKGINPLPWRAPNGSVYFPHQTEGWYWQPEANLVRQSATALEAWTFKPNCMHNPFLFIDNIYKERQRLRAKNHPGHIVLKLPLNGMYGKLAQKAGWNRKTGQAPRYHQLEWAGWITSQTRATMYRLAMRDPSSVIAFETDGLYSLNGDLLKPGEEGEDLGQWDRTFYADIVYCQSGIYWVLKNGEWKTKSRGLSKTNPKNLTVDQLLSAWESGQSELVVHGERFVTLGAAMVGDLGLYDWRQWIDYPKTIQTTPSGKRVPLPADISTGNHYRPGLHRTFTLGGTGPSTPHHLPWINDSIPEYVENLSALDLEDEWESGLD